MHYLEKRKKVIEAIKEGRVGDAKRMLSEEIKALKYLKIQLQGQYKQDTGYRRLFRPMDEPAKLKMARYNVEHKFYSNLLRGIRSFEKKVAT